MKITVKNAKDERLNVLSQRMYEVMYPNNTPNYKLTSDEFMQLLFVLDELSLNPILRG